MNIRKFPESDERASLSNCSRAQSHTAESRERGGAYDMSSPNIRELHENAAHSESPPRYLNSAEESIDAEHTAIARSGRGPRCARRARASDMSE